jgi:RNA polymerase sigma factor (TIGR02999 family)
MESSLRLTELLLRWGEGDRSALARLTEAVHGELHRLARIHMAKERPGHTLQATALVNEAYLRLVDTSRVKWRNRAHFFAVAAGVMRRILIDYARRRANQKRGGGWQQVTWGESLGAAGGSDPDVLALDQALDRLAKLDPRKAQVVEMRFFRRAVLGRDRGGAPDFGGHRRARLGLRQGLAAAGTETVAKASAS